MHDETIIPEHARCLTCGYQLHGLPRAVCPECGRSFDAADPSTFDTRPVGWRRRRWIKRGCIALAIALLVFVLFPRRLIRSNMTFTCTQCGTVIKIRRWEPQSPRWLPFRYPGYHSSARNDSSPATGTASCTHDSQKVSVGFDLYNGGNCRGSGLSTPQSAVTFNGMAALPDKARAILKSLTAPSNNGIMVFNQPTSAPAEPTGKRPRVGGDVK